MNELIKNLKEKRGLKERTINFYKRNLEILAEKVTKKPFKNLDFLGRFEEIIEFLEKNKISTRKNKTASIITSLNVSGEKYQKLEKFYNDYLYEINLKYDKTIAENKKTLRESDNWVSLEDLRKVWNTMKKRILLENINKNKFVTKKQWKFLQEFVICSLYILQEPRRCTDFSEMKFIDKKIFDKLPQSYKDKNNYFVYENGKALQLSYGDYKTAKDYGHQIYNIPKKLKTVLNMWIKHRRENQQYLLLNNRGQKMSSNSLTKYLWEIFSITGKPRISCCMLRHIYITEDQELKEYREAKKKAEEKASKMAHSLKMQDKYVRK